MGISQSITFATSGASADISESRLRFLSLIASLYAVAPLFDTDEDPGRKGGEGIQTLDQVSSGSAEFLWNIWEILSILLRCVTPEKKCGPRWSSDHAADLGKIMNRLSALSQGVRREAAKSVLAPDPRFAEID